MASPQKEHGFTPYATELYRALIREKLSGHEWRILGSLAIDSYGRSRKETPLSLSEIAAMTGMPRSRVNEAMQSLVARKIVLPLWGTVERASKRIVRKINKDYDQWGGTVERTSTVERASSGTVERAGTNKVVVKKEKHLHRTRSPFVPPTPEEASSYATTQGFVLDGHAFVDHYAAASWMRGKTKITDWKACVRTWKKNATPKGKTNGLDFN